MKQFVKALHLDGECFQHILRTFPGLSYKKIKAGVFDGPQIRTLVRDQAFVQAMNDKEKAAWLIKRLEIMRIELVTCAQHFVIWDAK